MLCSLNSFLELKDCLHSEIGHLHGILGTLFD